MIVKAISHKCSKKSSIKKLITYVFDPNKMKDKNGEELIVKQMISGYDKSKWADQFKQNDELRNFQHSKRTVLRHELISFSPESAPYLSRETLKTIAKYYLSNRAPRAMGVATIHYDENLHIHFIIAGVSIDGDSTRISRKNFKDFKIQLQEFQKQNFPELSHSVVDHSKKKAYT